MSERSERVGRPSDAPPTSGLATGVAAERATTTPPEDPPAPTDSQRRQPRYEQVRVGSTAVRVGTSARGGIVGRQGRGSWADRRGRIGRGRIGRAPLLGRRRGRRVLRRGASRSLATDDHREGRVSGARSLRPWRFAPSSLRSTAIPLLRPRHRLRQHDTAVLLRLSLAGSSRFAPLGQAPHCVRRGARSHLHNWRRCRPPPTAFVKGARSRRPSPYPAYRSTKRTHVRNGRHVSAMRRKPRLVLADRARTGAPRSTAPAARTPAARPFGRSPRQHQARAVRADAADRRQPPQRLVLRAVAQDVRVELAQQRRLRHRVQPAQPLQRLSAADLAHFQQVARRRERAQLAAVDAHGCAVLLHEPRSDRRRLGELLARREHRPRRRLVRCRERAPVAGPRGRPSSSAATGSTAAPPGTRMRRRPARGCAPPGRAARRGRRRPPASTVTGPSAAACRSTAPVAPPPSSRRNAMRSAPSSSAPRGPSGGNAPRKPAARASENGPRGAICANLASGHAAHVRTRVPAACAGRVCDGALPGGRVAIPCSDA